MNLLRAYMNMILLFSSYTYDIQNVSMLFFFLKKINKKYAIFEYMWWDFCLSNFVCHWKRANMPPFVFFELQDAGIGTSIDSFYEYLLKVSCILLELWSYIAVTDVIWWKFFELDT